MEGAYGSPLESERAAILACRHRPEQNAGDCINTAMEITAEGREAAEIEAAVYRAAW